MTPHSTIEEVVEEANYLFPSLAQGLEKVGDNGVPYVSDKTGLDWLRSALSQARQEGKREVVEYIKDNALRTGSAEIMKFEDGRFKAEGVKLGDYIVPEGLLDSALTTEGK